MGSHTLLAKLVRWELADRISSRTWVLAYWSTKEATDSSVTGWPARVKNQWLLSSLRERAVCGAGGPGAARAAAGRVRTSRRRSGIVSHCIRRVEYDNGVAVWIAGGLFETADVEGDSDRWPFLAAGDRSGGWHQPAGGGEVAPWRTVLDRRRQLSARTLHWLGVACGFAAGAWLGAAEAPTKLVTAGFSPFIISLGMVAGVFVARWTVPMMLKGTGYIWLDLKEKKHLMVWAILAGMLWAVANTLTVFAITQRRALDRVSAVEHQQPGGTVLGLAAVQRIARLGREPVAEGAGRSGGDRRGCVRAGVRHSAPIGLGAGGSGGAWHHGGARRGSAVGHDVHPLSQGVHQRHESAVVRHGVHVRRVGDGVRAGAGLRRRLRRT